MRNKKIYQQLETIIETSLSPKRRPVLNTRILCSPNISLSSISSFKNHSNLKNSNIKIKIANRDACKQEVVNEFKQKSIFLNPHLTAWQQMQYVTRLQQKTRIDNPKNYLKLEIQSVFVSLVKICIKMAAKYARKQQILTIVLLQAKGKRKQAILKALGWMIGWVKTVFSFFSELTKTKALDI